ncbi:hypothetical protein LRS71_06955 [Rhodococcus pyridinivorans]|uniref:hypothetical protein n=1 Tax=Rhodococcus pyridinivorans TaxID=103816 RepID=UPI001E56B7CC|nr:hypothetical protein [Rhodococcus pyridinivorans]MCD5419298.1 hypothetical protein [Rhodococcus pyridinivorans]
MIAAAAFGAVRPGLVGVVELVAARSRRMGCDVAALHARLDQLEERRGLPIPERAEDRPASQRAEVAR